MKNILALACLLLVILVPDDAWAQPRTVRVAYVYMFKFGPAPGFAQPFRARLDELGWKEGQNLRFEEHDADGDSKRLDAIMQDLVRTKVDVIVAMCTPEAAAARRATSTIPIVVTAAGDLIAAGLVTSYQRPGGNITGMSGLLTESAAKRVELLTTSFPKVKVATVLWNPARPDNAVEVAALQATARRTGVELRSVRRPGDPAAQALRVRGEPQDRARPGLGDARAQRLGPRLAIVVSADGVWRTSVRDGIYGAGANILAVGASSRSRYVGWDVDTTLNWRLSRQVVIGLSAGYFRNGTYSREAGLAQRQWVIAPVLYIQL
jgi:hypothetical protein